MSFVPPDSSSVPRSTPIPGTESAVSDFGMPGDAGSVPPLSPSQFLKGISSSPGPTFQTAPGADFATPKRRRSWGTGVLVAILFVGPVLGVGVGIGIWAFTRANDVTGQILDGAQKTPSADAPAMNFFLEGGAPALIASFDDAISGEPSRLMEVVIYPEYAFATAQDADNLLHVDKYPWRDGAVAESSPVTLTGGRDLESKLFSTTDVDWSFIARAVAEAPSRIPTVEEGVVSHIIVDRSVFTRDFSVVVRVYVTGPRGSGYAVYTSTGQFVEVMV